MKTSDYVEAVLYPFHFDVKEYNGGAMVVQCQEIPAIIGQVDSATELKVRSPFWILEYFNAQRKWEKMKRKENKRKKKNESSH